MTLERFVCVEDDLEKLKEVYWDIERRGKDYEPHAEALSRIYYYCEARLKAHDVIEEPVAIEMGSPIRMIPEEDTTGIAYA